MIPLTILSGINLEPPTAITSPTTPTTDKSNFNVNADIEEPSIAVAEEPYPEEHRHSPDWNRMEDENDVEVTRISDKNEAHSFDEKSPLLSPPELTIEDIKNTSWWSVPGRITQSVIGAIKVVLSAVTAPGRYIITLFYDEQGRFSAISPVYKLAGAMTGQRQKTLASEERVLQTSEKGNSSKKPTTATRTRKTMKGSTPAHMMDSAVSSDSEVESIPASGDLDSPARHTRSRTSISQSSGDEIAPSKRSIRIRLHNDEAKQRKRKGQNRNKDPNTLDPASTEDAAAALKSPPNPATAAKITKFPRTPQPPRPLVPRRQPSYSAAIPNLIGPHPHPYKKTLVIDLDETLIHSMSKGGRYTTGHMVEVKLQNSMTVAGTGQVLTPQVPILYYVHKRPYCDEFLRKVSKWFNLIVFTASVQEYADPVINWLELERKYFYGRLYRQHCTHRNGGYIKDLSQVEPDLSKVMILDNSPVSYVFHEDNAIPIEGWISDPTDNDLLHLIPFLEGLQYVTDVRALLALRLGQPQSA